MDEEEGYFIHPTHAAHEEPLKKAGIEELCVCVWWVGWVCACACMHACVGILVLIDLGAALLNG